MTDFAPRHYFENTPVVTVQYRGASRRWKLVYATFLEGAWYFGVRTPDDTRAFEVLQADVVMPPSSSSPAPVPPPPEEVAASPPVETPPGMVNMPNFRFESGFGFPGAMSNHYQAANLHNTTRIVPDASVSGSARRDVRSAIVPDAQLDALNAAMGFPSMPRPQIVDPKHAVSIQGEGRHEITIDGRKHTVTSAELRDMTGNRLSTLTLEEIAAILILRDALGKIWK